MARIKNSLRPFFQPAMTCDPSEEPIRVARPMPGARPQLHGRTGVPDASTDTDGSRRLIVSYTDKRGSSPESFCNMYCGPFRTGETRQLNSRRMNFTYSTALRIYCSREAEGGKPAGSPRAVARPGFPQIRTCPSMRHPALHLTSLRDSRCRGPRGHEEDCSAPPGERT